MQTLTFPTAGSYIYPMKHYPGMNNLRRVTTFNERAFRGYVDQNPFNLENQHLLVGILQQLAIDPEWDLDYVVSYTRFRSNSLATVFKINSISGVGEPIKDGLYREGTTELWGLLEHDKVYPQTIRLEDLRPVVPVYTNILKRGYKLTVERSLNPTHRGFDMAIIGLNLVELAIGWWLYMREDRDRDTGIHAYLCKYPLYYAQLMHNQGLTVNYLYEFFVRGVPLKDLWEMEQVKFTTLGEEKLYKEYFSFRVDFLTSRKLVDIGHLVASVDNIYHPNYFNYEDGGRNKLLSQTRWLWEPNSIRWYSIYFAICNALGHPVGDVKARLKRTLPIVHEGFNKCPSTLCRESFKRESLELHRLILKNK
ncbi:hypothetical protein D3C79_47890 [compost metagenome]